MNIFETEEYRELLQALIVLNQKLDDSITLSEKANKKLSELLAELKN